MENQNSRFSLNKIFEYCLLGLVFITPIFFVPSLSVSLYVAKIVFLVTITVLFIGAFLAETLSNGIIQFPKVRFLIPLAVFPFIAFLSSFFSGQAVKSVAGNVFDFGTSGSLFILSLISFLVVFAVRENMKLALKSIYAYLLAAVVVILHLLLRMVAPILPVALASRIPNFLVGGSIDTSLFLGAAVIISLSALNMLNLSKFVKAVIYAVLIISMLFIGAVGFTPSIVVVGLFALVYFVYTFSWKANSESGHRSSQKGYFPSLLVLVLSIVFVLSGGWVGGYLSSLFKQNSLEVRPSLSITMEMTKEAIKKNPILGVGPNMFKELWDEKKPADINSTQFWASEFSFGSGLIPTLTATTGLLGILAILAFLVLYVKTGFKAIFAATSDTLSRYVSSTLFFITLFFWVMSFTFVPSISIMALAFVFTGVFAGTLGSEGGFANFKANIFKNPKANFASVFLIVVFLIASIAGGYFVWERAVAASVFQNGVVTLSKGDVDNGRLAIARSIQLSPTDIYWRGFSESSLSKFVQQVSSVSSAQNMTDADKSLIQGSISDSVEGARQAIAWNSKNFENWFALGRVYELMAQNGIEGALENSKAAYVEAQNRAPLNPAIPLALGRLAAISNDLNGARDNIKKAIEMKSNFTDAYFTLAQVEAAANNIPAAIQSVESATLVDPNNTGLYFQLGLLKYNQLDWNGAALAFARAVQLVPDYANAKYFLGLSLERLGKRADAIVQFEDIAKTNPDNQEVNFILTNLKAGKSPFTDAKPPVTDKPEKRTELPVQEKKAAE